MDAIWWAAQGCRQRLWVIGRWSWAKITVSSKTRAMDHARRLPRAVIGVAKRQAPRLTFAKRNGRAFLPQLESENVVDMGALQ